MLEIYHQISKWLLGPKFEFYWGMRMHLFLQLFLDEGKLIKATWCQKCLIICTTVYIFLAHYVLYYWWSICLQAECMMTSITKVQFISLAMRFVYKCLVVSRYLLIFMWVDLITIPTTTYFYLAHSWIFSE